jgi:hypothetical protein
LLKEERVSILSRIASVFKRPPADPVIRLLNDGFALLDPGSGVEIRTVHWADVSRIQTYKIDLVTTDCICLLFESRSGAEPTQVCEEWQGFADLFEPLSAAFPTLSKSWYMEVMQPAFETKRTVLYDARSAS